MKKGESAAFIRLKLLEKGVDRKKAEEAVRILKESSEYEESVKKAVLRMMEKKEEGKALSSLARKGYSMAEIRNALKGDC